MKVKHVFTTLGLALVMGMGVAAGASLGTGVIKAKAATTTIYAKMEHDWWKADGAAIGIYAWDGGDKNAAWPGQRMSAVTGVTDLWSIDIDTAAYSNVIFTRVNASGAVADWGAQTKDLTFPTDGKNMFTITTSSATWGGDPGCDGEWGTYVPPVAPSVYEVSINGGTAVELVKNGSTTEYTFASNTLLTAGDVLTFYKDDELQAVTVKPDGGLSTNNVSLVDGDITVSKTATTNLYWDVNTNELWVEGYGSAVDGSVYLVGSFNGWGGIRTVATTEDNVNYTFSNVALSANATIKAFKYDASGANDDAKHVWVQPTAATSTFSIEFPVSFEQNGNVTVTNANTYNVSVNITTGAYTIDPTSGTPTYKVTCDLEEQTFVLDEDGKPEGVYHQYSATVEHGYRASVLEFYIGDVKITDHIGVDYENDAPKAGNNIVGDVTNGFRIYHNKENMKIYLKTYEDGGMSLWGDGYDELTFYMSHYNYIISLDDEFNPQDGYEKQFKTANEKSIAVRADNEGKYYITDEIGRAQSIQFETAGDNNAYSSTSPTGTFNVYNACNEFVYIKMKADLSLTLYIGGRTHTRTLTIGSTDYQLESYQPEGEPLQYRVTGVDLTGGETISYKLDGVAQTITAKAIGNNNLTSELKVLADAASADLYLDPENMTLWVSGLGLEGATGFHLLIKNSDSHTTEFLKMTQNPANENEYFSSAHAFKCNDVIKIVDCSHSDSLPYVFDPKGGLNDNSNDAFILNDFGEVYCQEDVTVSAYIQLASNNDKLYFGSVPAAVQEAIRFTTDFASHMHNSCSTENGKQAAVEAAWAQAAGEYALLSAEAKAELAKGSLENCEHDEIADFYERYMSIKTQHSDWDLADFMGWAIPSSSNYFFGGIAKNNNALIIVLVAMTIAISSVGLFFIIRRKKYSK